MSQSHEVGYVTSTRNYLVYIDGLPSIQINDMVENESGVRGFVSNLLPNLAEVLILDSGDINPGQLFQKSDNDLSVQIGESVLGRALNPLGTPLDGHGAFTFTPDDKQLPLDQPATGIVSRQFINQQFVTGVGVIDTLIPLGKGQRELIVGDAHSGKTSFIINLLLNQKTTEVVCVYVMIGKPASQIRQMIDILNANQALDHTVIVATSSSDTAPLIYLTPYTGFTIAQYFQKRGRDVLLILDDMGNHAKIYREIALLSDRSPGRESYPGDIFYQHAHLLERAGNYRKEFGGGSLTALPVIELNLNDFTTYIPTNLMSMTDGHLMFRSSLHNQGHKPAIDITLSVSRVGRQTQMRVQNSLSQRIRQVIADANGLETVSRFSSELPYETQLLLRQKNFIEEMMRQDIAYIPIEVQTILFGLIFTSFLREKPISFLIKNKSILTLTFLENEQFTPINKIIPKLQSDTELFELLEKLSPDLNKICKP